MRDLWNFCEVYELFLLSLFMIQTQFCCYKLWGLKGFGIYENLFLCVWRFFGVFSGDDFSVIYFCLISLFYFFIGINFVDFFIGLNFVDYLKLKYIPRILHLAARICYASVSKNLKMNMIKYLKRKLLLSTKIYSAETKYWEKCSVKKITIWGKESVHLRIWT